MPDITMQRIQQVTTIAAPRLSEYQQRVISQLDRLYSKSDIKSCSFDIETARLVFFSDHHRGARDGADDFLRCEPAYHAALAYYLELGHTLFLLGDVEELWECHPNEVLASYERTLALEAEFHRRGRYYRIWGNHDDYWRKTSTVERHLGEMYPGLRAHLALKVEIRDGSTLLGTLFATHGQQGSADSDRFAWASKLAVHYIWRPLQRHFRIASTSPARDLDLREDHDVALFTWARRHPERPIIIAGHTHRPVFCLRAKEPVEPVDTEDTPDQQGIRGPVLSAVEHARAEFEDAKMRGGQRRATPLEPPCYFNTGCCSFGDGDVTALEICDGEIRLVRWPDDDQKPRPKVLAEADFREILGAARGDDTRTHISQRGDRLSLTH